MQLFGRPVPRGWVNRWVAAVILAGMTAGLVLILWLGLSVTGKEGLSLPTATRPLILMPIPRD